MATILKNVLRFTGLVVGVPVQQAHLLNINGVAKAPQNAWVNGGGFTVTADATNVTVIRGASAADAVDIAVERWHTMEDCEPLPSGISPSVLPFIMGNDGGGISGISVEEDGTPIVAPAAAVNFIGALVTDVSGVAQVNIPQLNIKGFGAVGDGTTDDRAAFQAAIALANTMGPGTEIRVPPGTYKISKYLDFSNVIGITIKGSAFSVVKYPSADSAIPLDAVVNSTGNPTMASRSGFLLRNCSNVLVEGLTFQGDNVTQLTTLNVGAAMYLSRARNVIWTNCVVYDGAGPISQDDTDPSTGTGDSMTAAAGVVTLVDAGASFFAGQKGLTITINNSTNPINDGQFLITEVVSATSIRWANADAITETSSFTWTINDEDTGTTISKCKFINCRRNGYTSSNASWSQCEFRRPLDQDLAGRITSITNTAGTTTLVSARAPWTKSLIGKYIQITGATNGGNVGLFKILSVTPGTGVATASLTYANGAGVTEQAPNTATWWIQNGEKTGIGNGASALSKTGSTMTLTSSVAAFSATDIGKTVRITQATTANNNGIFVITGSPASNQITYENAVGATEAFTKGWAVASYDRMTDASGNLYGSTHAIYYFAGRNNITITDCHFFGIREYAAKFSGSSSPIRNVSVTGCLMVECGGGLIFGADDSQEHINCKFTNNRLVDCATQRPGWSGSIGVNVNGSKSVTIQDNTLFYTRPAIPAVDGRNTVAGLYGIAALRYLSGGIVASGTVMDKGTSQPVESVEISGNLIEADEICTNNQVLQVGIFCDSVGILSRYRSATAALPMIITVSGTLVTLTDPSSSFDPEVADGCTITTVNFADAGNNVTDIRIENMAGVAAIQFTNAAAVAGSKTVGTFRISYPAGKRGGTCRIAGNEMRNSAQVGIQTQSCVGPEIVGNVFSAIGTEIDDVGSCRPRITGTRRVGFGAGSTPGILLRNNTSFPTVADNLISGGGLQLGNAASARGDIGIGVTVGTKVDFPLCGMSGRCKVSNGQPQMIIGYGSKWVDGDSINVNGTTLTYKNSAPGAGQFNGLTNVGAPLNEYGTTVTQGLLERINAIAAFSPGNECQDYGSFLTPAVATGHILLRNEAVSTTADLIYITDVKVLNPTACVVPFNDVGGGVAVQYSRGEASGGPVPDKTVVWSLDARYAGGVTLIPDNASAKTLIAAGYYRHLKNSKNAGCCEVIEHDAAAGTEEFRWTLF